MRIGVFGGSFNPIHKYHEQIAHHLVKNNYLDKVIFVPTGNKYHYKNISVPDEIRLKMINLVTNKYDYFEVDDYELQDKEIFTCETLKYLSEKNPEAEIYFICGTDNLTYVDKWHDGLNLLKNYKFMCLRRKTDSLDEILTRFNDYKDNIIVIDMEESELSSTYIRNNIDKEEIKDYLDIDVYTFIKENNLYKK